MNKYLPIALFSGTMSFALFAFMAYLVSSDDVSPPIIDDDVTFTIAQTPPDMKVNIKPKALPPQPPAPPQPPRVIEDVPPTDIETSYSYTMEKLPQTATSTLLNGGSKIIDAEARPIIRINPKYPMEAAQSGIQGWVQLIFSINEIGEVTDIRILDSQPKRIFDQAAKQALRKWKYEAKKEGGKAIVQENITVQLDFSLENEQS